MEPERLSPEEHAGSPEEGQDSEDRFTVVGIGASAGGLDALASFFEATPTDTGIAFVVILHLSPEYESNLAELLQRHTAMPVSQVTETVEVAPDHVYVIPPNRNLSMTDEHLGLTSMEEPPGHRVPIDVFFRALARTHGRKAVGAILSGAGSDGTVGLKAIKEHGGLVLVQAPEEAAYDSMPRNAIATGVVDFVLPVRELAAQLVEYHKRDGQIQLPEPPAALPKTEAETLTMIFAQLRAETGHDFSNYKRSTVLRRIGRRMQVHGIESLAAYLGYLRTRPEEARALFKDLLISVTNFFRDREAFDFLEAEVVPKLFEGKEPGEPVRVWVAGCATGEEAYSIAILLCEYASRLGRPPEIQIFASDLDEQALASAREGLYPDAVSVDVSPERLKRFFVLEGGHYRIKREVRERVLFAPHNLLKDPPFSRLDLITCRNLLIYLQRDMQERVLDLFHYVLLPGGYLFLGASESAEGAMELFRTVSQKHRIYRRKEGVHQVTRLSALPLPDTPAARGRFRSQRAGRAVQPSEAELHLRMLEAYAPPSVIVDENYDIVHLSEHAGRYLQYSGGKPTFNVVKAVREELQLELRTALYQVFHHGKATSSRPVRVRLNGGQTRLVHLIVRPAGEDAVRGLALILFGEVEEPEAAADREPAEVRGVDPLVRQLEDELQQTKERLQATIEEQETANEELKASNEELQSMNEEYKSTAEELETSKEELQSVNEELTTLNQELKDKVDELSRANSDLQNLMASTEIGTIFLDREMHVKRYTPRVADLFNIIASDRGRPVAHVTHNLNYPGLVEDAEQVLKQLTPVEREVQAAEGQWFLVRLRPYRTVEDRIEGVVITFVDITRRKSAEEELRRSEEQYRLLVDSVKEYAIFMLDTERRVITWNEGAERICGYTEEEILGLTGDILFTEEDRRAGVPEQEIRTAIAEGHAADERWHVRKDGRRFWASGIMTALWYEQGVLRGFTKVMRDNTLRKQAEAQLQELNETLEQRIQERTAQVRALASDLSLAEQRERRRISEILHDHLQQLLYGLQIKFQVLRSDLAAAGKDVAKEVEETGDILEEAIRVTRTLTVELSPPVLKGEGLTAALQWLAVQMEETHGLEVELDLDTEGRLPDDDRRVLLFQLVRELLFNVVKHAGVDRARLTLREEEGQLRIAVEDEGRGFDARDATARPTPEGTFGLFSVRERLDLIGGRLEIDTAPGEGTRMTILVPL